MRDQLIELCFGLDRQSRWFPTLKGLADNFVRLHGSDVECSGLIESVPVENGQLEAPPPSDDHEALRQVRESFSKWHPTSYIPYLESKPLSPHVPPPKSWNLPPAARTDPRAFWAEVFDSFDFSSPQYFDTTLSLKQQ